MRGLRQPGAAAVAAASTLGTRQFAAKHGSARYSAMPAQYEPADSDALALSRISKQ